MFYLIRKGGAFILSTYVTRHHNSSYFHFVIRNLKSRWSNAMSNVTLLLIRHVLSHQKRRRFYIIDLCNETPQFILFSFCHQKPKIAMVKCNVKCHVIINKARVISSEKGGAFILSTYVTR